jgi:uncharacterized caspase-like protein
MARLLRDFGNAAHDGDTALFYYAGHGIAFNGGNGLLPVDDADVANRGAAFVTVAGLFPCSRSAP